MNPPIPLQPHSLIGRLREETLIQAAFNAKRHLLIEGPVGVGKTFLVETILANRHKKHLRIDGDSRYTEQKLVGYFDPPIVLKKGYTKEALIKGPLTLAMQMGWVLFINELNRMPEAVQNILLPAMDEHIITIPNHGMVKAKNGFLICATQNPKEFTATHHLSEALLDRFEMLSLSYLTEEQEIAILSHHFTNTLSKDSIKQIITLIRRTREHPSIKRGASLRAALSIAELMNAGVSFREAALMALSTRIEVSNELNTKDTLEELLIEMVDKKDNDPSQKKKKSF